jgi:hypothetical protein
MRFRLTSVTIALVACAPSIEKNDTHSSPVMVADSVVLERSVCFGLCPAYRLRLSKTGHVLYESRNPRESLVTGLDTVAPSTLPNMVRAAQTAGFFELPPEIAADSVLCPLRATDHATVVITIFGPEPRVVTDYLGCFATTERGTVPALTRLRAYEAEIDSVLGSSRWIHR